MKVVLIILVVIILIGITRNIFQPWDGWGTFTMRLLCLDFAVDLFELLADADWDDVDIDFD